METAGVEERTNEVAVADKNDKHTGSGVPAPCCPRLVYVPPIRPLVRDSFNRLLYDCHEIDSFNHDILFALFPLMHITFNRISGNVTVSETESCITFLPWNIDCRCIWNQPDTKDSFLSRTRISNNGTILGVRLDLSCLFFVEHFHITPAVTGKKKANTRGGNVYFIRKQSAAALSVANRITFPAASIAD